MNDIFKRLKATRARLVRAHRAYVESFQDPAASPRLELKIYNTVFWEYLALRVATGSQVEVPLP